jgi:hypothetical protein
MTDPADMIVPLLREMRAENLAQHERMRALVMALDERLDGVGIAFENRVQKSKGQK